MGTGNYGREDPHRGGGSALFLIFLALILLLRFGESERLVTFRRQLSETVSERVGGIDYERALEALGRSFSGLDDEESAVSVFGREILGFSAPGETDSIGAEE